MKYKVTRPIVVFGLPVLCLIAAACSKDQNTVHNHPGNSSSISQIIPNALKLLSGRPDQLRDCRPSTDSNEAGAECATGFECASLSMTDGLVSKCVEISKICDQSTCDAGNCLALLTEPAQVTCATPIGHQYGASGAAPPSSSELTDPVVATLTLDQVSGLKVSDNRVVFSAVDPDGKPAQIYLPTAKDQQCENQISLAISSRQSLSILGSWNAVSLPSFNGTTYQFDEGSYCYHGVPIGL